MLLLYSTFEVDQMVEYPPGCRKIIEFFICIFWAVLCRRNRGVTRATVSDDMHVQRNEVKKVQDNNATAKK